MPRRTADAAAGLLHVLAIVAGVIVAVGILGVGDCLPRGGVLLDPSGNAWISGG